MTRIASIIKGLEYIRDNEERIVKELLQSKNEEIVDLQKDQLLRGKTNMEENVAPRYANPRYAARKQAMNGKPPAGVPDLKLTGRYHRGFRAVINNDTIDMQNRDNKDARLSAKYAHIKGLSNKSVGKLRDIVRPELKRIVIKRLVA